MRSIGHRGVGQTPSTTFLPRSSARRSARSALRSLSKVFAEFLAFCNARQMTAPEAYIHYSPEVFTNEGEVTNDATAAFLSNFMDEFRTHIARVLTVIPRQ